METCETTNGKSDIELYKLFLKGDNDAFNYLIIKHRKMLTNFIMTYVKNIEIAEDIAQDSFMYMIINKVEYDFKYSFKTSLKFTSITSLSTIILYFLNNKNNFPSKAMIFKTSLLSP